MARILTTLFLAAGAIGCAGSRSYAPPEAYRGVRAVRLVDETSPILLQVSDAGKVAKLVRLVFEEQGYSVCTAPGCPADAAGTIQTTQYETGERTRIGPGAVLAPVKLLALPVTKTYSTVAFRLDIKRADGRMLLALQPYRQDTLPAEHLAGQLVQELLDYYVPKCSTPPP